MACDRPRRAAAALPRRLRVFLLPATATPAVLRLLRRAAQDGGQLWIRLGRVGRGPGGGGRVAPGGERGPGPNQNLTSTRTPPNHTTFKKPQDNPKRAT